MSKIAYLIQGPPSSGKTTFGQKQAAKEGGVCLSFDAYFYEVVNPEHPNEYNFDSKRLRSSTRWFWLKLKELADAAASPIYIDQNNIFQSHTWKTAAFLMERYDYDIELVHPDSVHWQLVRTLLGDKESNAEEIEEWAGKMSDMSKQEIGAEKMLTRLLGWEEYTVDDLIEQF